MNRVDDMSDEELEEEMRMLQSFKVPSSPVPKAPKKTTTPKAKSSRASWKSALGLED